MNEEEVVKLIRDAKTGKEGVSILKSWLNYDYANVDKVTLEVVKEFDITPSDLRKKSHSRKYSLPRAVCVYIKSLEYGVGSLGELSEMVAKDYDMNKASGYEMIKRVKERAGTNQRFRDRVNRILEKLNKPLLKEQRTEPKKEIFKFR